ncbi:MAG TPA: hypothetical protein VEZ15_13215 [Acidimicrobiia bacterium]|nr:hypothetical protein [Acidimicrobiia bacterium]
MTELTALDAQFSHGNVPLGVMLGAISALSTVRRVLPDATEPAPAAPRSETDAVEPFVALLLGVVAMHDRLTTLVDRAPAAPYEPTESEPLTATVPASLTR